MTATAAKPTKIQAEALRRLHAGQFPVFRSIRTQNALSSAGLIDYEHGRGWVITNAGLEAIGVEVNVEEEGLPKNVQNAAAGELNVTRDKHHRAPQYDVWIGQEHVGVIFDESDADMDREPMAAWSPKAGTKSGVVGFFGLIHEAAEAIRKLYEPTEEAADATPASSAKAPGATQLGTYETALTEALEGGFPNLLAHKVAKIRARRSEPSSTSRTFTVIYTGVDEPIVHAAGCAHSVRDSLAGAHTTEDITGTLEEVGRAVYSDMLEEGSMSPEDCIPNLHIKPCAR